MNRRTRFGAVVAAGTATAEPSVKPTPLAACPTSREDAAAVDAARFTP